MRSFGRFAASLVAAAGVATAVAAAPGSAGAEGAARPTASPIKHVLVLMQENRSFDSYFGQLHFQGQPRTAAEPRNASNPNPLNEDAPPIRAFDQSAFCASADLNHSWTGTHQEINGDDMNGFTAANVDPTDPTGSRAMGSYDSADLPFYYSLYSQFAMGDRYFSSVPGPTFPNREYLLAGTSFGHIMNDLPAAGLPGASVFNELDAAGVSWKIYFSDTPAGFLFAYVRAHAAGHVVPVSQYFVDAAAGNLPQVSFVDPMFGGTKNTETDEHPPANIQVGQQFVAGVVGALFKSPNWTSSALFLTYDEHGGYYDHVSPPRAVEPDGIAPLLGPGDVNAEFDRLGVRVPAVVVSPFAKAHFVSHVVNDHTSILRFIETRFGLPALTRRDAAANPMLEFFDFHDPAFMHPPALRPATIDPAQFAACAASAAAGSGGV
jgi:phospholipase C